MKKILLFLLLMSIVVAQPVLVSIPHNNTDIDNLKLDYKIVQKGMISNIIIDAKGLDNNPYWIEILHFEDDILIIEKIKNKDNKIEYTETKKGDRLIDNKNYLTKKIIPETSSDAQIIIQLRSNKKSRLFFRLFGKSPKVLKIDITPKVNEQVKITEKEFENFGIEAGKPIIWIKEIKLKNPSDNVIEDIIEIDIPMKCAKSYLIENNKKIDLMIKDKIILIEKIQPKQEKNQIIECITEPINIYSNIIKISNSKIMYEYYLQNNDNINYNDINIITEYNTENIRWIIGAKIVNDKTIKVNEIKKDDNKKISVIIEDKPPFFKPLVELVEDKLIIKTIESGYVNYYVELEVNGAHGTIFADIIDEKIKLDTKTWKSGFYNVKLKLRKDFTTYQEYQKQFFVLNGTEKLWFSVSAGTILFVLFLLDNKRKLFK